MIAIIAKLNVAAGKEAEFEAAFGELIDAVRANEPGNELYTLCKDEDGGYSVMELYKDEEALAAHGKSDHFRASGAKLGGVMAGAPEIIRMSVVK
ncbi:MAG: antibiotic biosynthesis monooxygenase [Pseudomonadaceae bacterium]|nr:antibiotic biosynthesis monooxygenase [Pseudomonadaceae bacterium]